MKGFEHTKEVSLKDFEEIWKQGGFLYTGNQFSNADKYLYLEVQDLDIQESKDNWNKELEKIPFSFYDCSPEEVEKKRELLYKLNGIGSTYIKNYTEVFDAGWVTNANCVGHSWETRELPSLPLNWKECYLCEKLVHDYSRKVLVAVNNGDGTAQLYCAI